MSQVFFIGADIGTSGAKIVLFDSKGNSIKESQYLYKTYYPKPGWIEQNPEEWWIAFLKGIHDLLEIIRSPDSIKGIGITHQRLTFVPVDEKYQPLRKAILWNDTRCYEENKWAEDKCGGNWVFQRTGCYPGLWSVYKVLWLKKWEREVYDQMFKIMLIFDYLCYKLTEKLCTTESAAIMTGCLDVNKRSEWAWDVLECLDIRKDIWIEPILPGGKPVGKISLEVANETGLSPETIIATTAGDQPCGSLGAGLLDNETIAINGGTSCTIEKLSLSLPKLDKADYFMEISPTGNYIIEESIYSGGSALMNWFRKNFYRYEEEIIKKSGENVWEKLYGLAKEVPPGNQGVFLIPYFSGAGAPFWDLSARGIIGGLLLNFGKPHIVRAIIEGLAFEAKRQIELIEKASGHMVKKVIMYGGSARSDVWNQIFADILQKPILVPKTVETTALGAAICAAVASGYYKSFDEAVKNMIGISRYYEPNYRYSDLYNELYTEIYKPFYGRIKDIINKISIIISKYENKITQGVNDQ